ncbi:N-acetylmuramoyl-L-alanine amidase [Candidatus Woesearchaeota archaeon]|nr:N-acetylmuramoyl-L-alanine amidase [Candidatus Woesearchaeota archaeon]
MKLNKKSVAAIDVLMWTLIGLILLALIFVIQLAVIPKITNNYLFQKNFVAIDSALIINSLYASPGNVFVAYKRSNFTGEFEKDLIFVKMNPKDKQRGSFIFYKDINLDNNFRFVEYDKTGVFSKTNSKFETGHAFKPDLRELGFEAVETTAILENQQIIIYPGETGLEFEGYNESEFTRTIAQNINVQGSGFTRVASEATAEGDALIIIHAAMSQEKQGPLSNPIIAYVPENSKKSKKFASLILNELLKNNIFSSVSLVPVDVSEVEEQSPMKALAQNEPSVLLEVGNLQDPKLKQNTVQIAGSIIKGIRIYYG